MWAAMRADRRETEMLTVSGLCMCNRCTSRTTDIYRMVGRCWNCGTEPILMLFRAGDKKAELDCPVCGNHWSVHPQRLATADEFPEALVGRRR